MSFQFQTHFQVTEKLLQDWRELWRISTCAHFFNHPSWFLACRDSFDYCDCRILTLYTDGRLAAILPLWQEKKFGAKSLVCPCDRYLAKSALLTKDSGPAALKAFVGHLAKDVSFYLSGIGPEAVDRNDVPAVLREAEPSPYIPLSGDPFFCLAKKQKSKLSAKAKKFRDRLYLVKFAGDQTGLDFAFAVDEKSAKRESGRPTFGNDAERRFFRELVLKSKEQVTVDVLFFDGVAIAYSINFVYGKVYHAFKTDYDKNFRHLSPGKLLLFHLLPRLKREGFDIFDFSRGVNILKKEFASLHYRQYDIYRARNIFIGIWWRLATGWEDLKIRLLENDTFYQKYLQAKRLLTKLGSKNASDAKAKVARRI